jgi:amino acid transporter
MRHDDSPDRLVRAVGFWGLVALCINGVVGSGVYLLPSEGFKFLGPFSLWAPVLFAIPVFILVLCFAEAASHFDRPGGAYLYTRTAFGDFIGFETGWMNTLARITSLASLSNGFVVSLARLVPEVGDGVPRALLISGALVLFGLIHAAGIKFGARTIYFFTWGKLLPLGRRRPSSFCSPTRDSRTWAFPRGSTRTLERTSPSRCSPGFWPSRWFTD